jgi:cell wall-associated NlpC family hydrolase
MTSPRGPRLRRVIATLVGVALMTVGLAFAATAGADRLADAQAEADRVEQELAALNVEVGLAAERYHAAQAELEETDRKIDQNQRVLKASKSNLRVSRNELRTMLVDAYRRGDPDVIAFLLSANSIDELVDQSRFVQRVTDHAAETVRDVRRYTREVREVERQLEDERVNRQAVLDQRAAEEAAVQGALAARSSLLDSLNGEIRSIIAEREAARRAEDERLAAAAAGVLDQAAAETGEAPALGGSVASGGGNSGGSGAAIPAPPSSSVGGSAASIALSQLGVPYSWGASSPGVGFDCSGLIYWAYAQVGVSLPRVAAAQYAYGVPVPLDAMEPGDIISFRGGGHAGIYIGGGQYVHAPQTGDVVKVSSVFDRGDIDGASRPA